MFIGRKEELKAKRNRALKRLQIDFIQFDETLIFVYIYGK